MAGLASDVGSGIFCIFPHGGEAAGAGGGGRGIKEMLSFGEGGGGQGSQGYPLINGLSGSNHFDVEIFTIRVITPIITVINSNPA